MTTREEIVAEARTWLGVKFRHQGRNRAGIDCAGLIEIVGQKFGLVGQQPWLNYDRLPDENKLIETVRAHLDEKPLVDWLPGDCVVMRDLDILWPMHMAMLYEYRPGVRLPVAVIHSNARRKRVVEHRMPPFWTQKITKCFQYRGLED